MAIASANRIKAALIALMLGFALVATLAQAAFAEDVRRLAIHNSVEISRCERFVAAEEFSVGRLIGERTLGSVSFNFAKFFLSAAIETDVQVLTLQAWILRYSADDASLIKRLGGEEWVVLPLCSIRHLMEMGSNGGSNIDKRSNFAYARSPVDGRLMAIHWLVNHDNEWLIGAVEVPHPHLDWAAGSRVFSRATVEATHNLR